MISQDTLGFILKTKDEIVNAFVFKKMVENQFDRKIRVLQSDLGGGGE